MLAVTGGKGGCGKTTTTLGLAAALVRQRRSVLAVDADREMPDLHAMAGVSRSPGLDAVAEGWPAGMVAGRADAPARGVSVLPAADGPPGDRPLAAGGNRTLDTSSRAAEADSGLPSTGSEPPLARVRGTADAVVLDCPAGAGPDAVAPLRVADAAVVVTTTEPQCLRDAAKTTAIAGELGTPVAGAVVSRAEESWQDAPPEGVARLLDCPVLGSVPDVGTGPDAETVPDTGASEAASPLADDRVRAAHDSVVSSLHPKRF